MYKIAFKHVKSDGKKKVAYRTYLTSWLAVKVERRVEPARFALDEPRPFFVAHVWVRSWSDGLWYHEESVRFYALHEVRRHIHRIEGGFHSPGEAGYFDGK